MPNGEEVKSQPSTALNQATEIKTTKSDDCKTPAAVQFTETYLVVTSSPISQFYQHLRQTEPVFASLMKVKKQVS